MPRRQNERLRQGSGHPLKMKPTGAILLTVTFSVLMPLWLLVGLFTTPLLYPIIKLMTGWNLARVTRLIIWLHGRGVVGILSPFVRLRRENLEGIARPCILVVNHLSFFDGYYMAALPFHDITFAVGAWPFRMYWYTLFMRLARYLDVENMAWEEVLAVSRDSFSQGGAVLFFPEGHRSRTGKLQQFHSGAFRLAADTGMPIVPICISGTGRLLPPGRRWLHPAEVTIKALPPVDPAGFPGSSGHMKMRRHVRQLIAAALKEEE